MIRLKTYSQLLNLESRTALVKYGIDYNFVKEVTGITSLKVAFRLNNIPIYKIWSD